MRSFVVIFGAIVFFTLASLWIANHSPYHTKLSAMLNIYPVLILAGVATVMLDKLCRYLEKKKNDRANKP